MVLHLFKIKRFIYITRKKAGVKKPPQYAIISSAFSGIGIFRSENRPDENLYVSNKMRRIILRCCNHSGPVFQRKIAFESTIKRILLYKK